MNKKAVSEIVNIVFLSVGYLILAVVAIATVIRLLTFFEHAQEYTTFQKLIVDLSTG